jgi:hypothetical protein
MFPLPSCILVTTVNDDEFTVRGDEARNMEIHLAKNVQGHYYTDAVSKSLFVLLDEL